MGWNSVTTLEVSVAFASDPLAAPSWTDITAYVKSVKIAYGRSHDLEPFDQGTCTVVLDNSDRRFDPLHAAGPYYGDLLPNKQLRVRATYSATTYDVFYGYVDGWPQDYQPPSSAVCEVRATDAFKLLGTAKLPGSVYELEVLADSPDGWWRMQETDGEILHDSSGNGRDITLSIDHAGKGLDLAAYEGNRAQLLFEDVSNKGTPYTQADYPSGYITDGPASGPVTLEFWLRTEGQPTLFAWDSAFGYILLNGGTKPQVIYRDGTNLVTNSALVGDGRIHHVVYSNNGAGTSELIYVDGVSVATTKNGVSLPIWLAGPYSPVYRGPLDSLLAQNPVMMHAGEWAIYPSQLSAARILAHYQAGTNPWNGDTPKARANRILDAIGWPSGLRNLDTGAATMGAAKIGGLTALDYLNRVAATEQGLLYVDHRNAGKVRFEGQGSRWSSTRSNTSQFTLTDDPAAAAPAYRYSAIDLQYDDRDLYNEVKVKWCGGEEVVQDATSITTYGLKSKSIETELPTASAARSLGGWVLARYKDPSLRCKSVMIDPSVQTGLFTPALGAKISDRFTIRRLPQGTGSAITKDVLIEGIEHEISDGVGTWRTTFRCSEADVTPYWVWGTSTWDTTTRWG